MTVNSYLVNLASDAVVRNLEKESINKSIDALDKKLFAYFGEAVSKRLIFGSYSRGTILPRFMDEASDVDYMVIFSDSNYQPQTYLEQLRRFAEASYQRSEVFKSSPTIVLELNHIRFELVPAISGYFTGLQIPSSGSSFTKWHETNPTDFNEKLTRANQDHNNLIKPLVRLVKYWNATNGYVFESYQLEKNVVGRGYWPLNMLSGSQLKTYFYAFMDDLSCGIFDPQWKQEKVTRLKQLIREAKDFESRGDDFNAERKIQKLLPPVGLQGLNALMR